MHVVLELYSIEQIRSKQGEHVICQRSVTFEFKKNIIASLISKVQL